MQLCGGWASLSRCVACCCFTDPHPRPLHRRTKRRCNLDLRGTACYCFTGKRQMNIPWTDCPCIHHMFTSYQPNVHLSGQGVQPAVQVGAIFLRGDKQHSIYHAYVYFFKMCLFLLKVFPQGFTGRRRTIVSLCNI